MLILLAKGRFQAPGNTSQLNYDWRKTGPDGLPLHLVLHLMIQTGTVSSTGGNDSFSRDLSQKCMSQTIQMSLLISVGLLAHFPDKMRLTFIIHSGNLPADSKISKLRANRSLNTQQT